MIGRAKHLCLIIIVGIGLWYAFRPRSGYATDSATRPSTQPAGVAVVELFTSQGCSSCPPAEKVLADLSRVAESEGHLVFTLAFHVDYWNRLGWTDPFSDAAFSRRQEKYAKAFSLDQIYTPQMVVNGRTQFVGSDGKRAGEAVADALAAPAEAAVTVAVHGTGRDGYKVHATVAGAGADAVVNVAVVERGLSTDVKSGENGGQRLDQPSVVRWFKTVPASSVNDIVVPSLPGVRTDRTSVVVYAQRPEHGVIIGAAAAPLP